MKWADRVGRHLKLRDLHILLAVVQRGSMAKAAAELAISQPAVSKAISDMEHIFGLRLLDRSRNGIEPTAYGRALVMRGRAIFDELKHGVEELAFLADPSVGDLRIGSTESVAAGFLPAVIKRFSLEQPRVRLDVAQTVMSTLHYRELRERSIDLLIGRIPAPFDEHDLEAEVVYNDDTVVIAGQRSKWAKSRKLKLADLAGERWILPPPDTMQGTGVPKIFRDSGFDNATCAHHNSFNSFMPSACRERTICDDASSLGTGLRQQRRISQGPSNQDSRGAAACRNRNPQESYAQPGSKAFH